MTRSGRSSSDENCHLSLKRKFFFVTMKSDDHGVDDDENWTRLHVDDFEDSCVNVKSKSDCANVALR